jgi:hypothetical protein
MLPKAAKPALLGPSEITMAGMAGMQSGEDEQGVDHSVVQAATHEQKRGGQHGHDLGSTALDVVVHPGHQSDHHAAQHR